MTKIEAEKLGVCMTCASYCHGKQFCGYGNLTQMAEERHLCPLTARQLDDRRVEWEIGKDGGFTGKLNTGR